jgi:hypothetical protein
MNDLRATISWLLLVMVGVVGAGAAVLGISQAPKNVPLHKAVENTLAASSYTEMVTQSSPQGTQTDFLVYQAPDRLGGYIQSGTKRTYVYVIGNYEYQSLATVSTASSRHLVFYQQPSEGVSAVDPAYNYLTYATKAKGITSSGSTYTFTLTQNGQTGTFVYTVSGNYVSTFSVSVQTASVHLAISQVGTSPPVALPLGAKVISSPAGSSAPGGSASSAG